MKKALCVMCVVGVAMAMSAPAMASGPSLFGSSMWLGQAPPPAPAGEAPKPMPMAAAPEQVELFQCVKYVDLHEMAPCAVPMIIQVKDPCWKPCCDPCSCCPPVPKCVNICICVPKQCCQPCCDPCGGCCPPPGPKVCCRRNGTRICYDYGKYEIDIRVKKGYIEVDYQD
jgi:hypothetical protein